MIEYEKDVIIYKLQRMIFLCIYLTIKTLCVWFAFADEIDPIRILLLTVGVADNFRILSLIIDFNS